MLLEKSISRPAVRRPNPFRPRFPLFMELALKELWGFRGRYFLISLVIALITVLVLFIAGLAEGLGAGNIEYLSKLNADLVLLQEKAELNITASRFNRGVLNNVRRIEGVAAVGSVGFSSAVIENTNGDTLDVSLIGVEPGRPGEPAVVQGRALQGKRDKEAIIGRNVALQTGLQVGDRFTLKTVQGSKEKRYTLRVAGISDGQQYSIRPGVIVPYLAWEQVKPKADTGQTDLSFNIMAVRLAPGVSPQEMAERLEKRVRDVQAVDLPTAYEATPGYQAQQSTLNTQRLFTLLIGMLVVGGFFQIQALQKAAQVGMLKAIGISSLTIGLALLFQIVAITLAGVALGGAGTLLLALNFPVSIPIVFTPQSVIAAVSSLLIIGPLGGLVSLRMLLKIEPLTALGLAS